MSATKAAARDDFWKQLAQDNGSERDLAYGERNKLVALLAALFPSLLQRTEGDGEGDEFRWCCFIELPSGQISFHLHDSELLEFSHVLLAPAGSTPFDGHTTPEKWLRVRVLQAACDEDS